mmetsp:Transcript_9791/g.31821  ORF Transcript_9791/g.31821 Transcript_9791/m.31821 type:complete len:195 (-) Transcript_9791:186-770(-)|eukprot:CAMPEP_0182895488 /NCGR_PEP_ID=MMETSP0034_2-20130328/25713_1 /TAXON_ID=156128 /ORGANISM="Nephroselmis pyriformis, Strain CCMP717" /LENGTH=194 /DNA_ID=CAMNT_0025029323 /DNA_START=73 /DNA_END=657 /DNA_ORIENTATION=-
MGALDDFSADIERLRGGDLEKIPTEQFADACSHLQPIFDSLGTVLYFASADFKSKTADVRGCAEAYASLDAILAKDVAEGTVTVKNSHSRNLRGLRRGLHFMQLVIKLLCADPSKALSAAGSEAYAEALAPYHPWAVRMAVRAGVLALPGRAAFIADFGATEETLKSTGGRLVESLDVLIPAVDKLYPPEALTS